MSLFEVKVEGADGLQRILRDMRVRAQGLDHALPTIAQMLVSAVSDIVEMQGPGWPQLSDVTLARRRKRGSGALMLRDTGVMMESLTGVVGTDYVEAFFGAPYAIAHIEGKGVPKRNPLNIGPVESGLIEDVTELLLTGLL